MTVLGFDSFDADSVLAKWGTIGINAPSVGVSVVAGAGFNKGNAMRLSASQTAPVTNDLNGLGSAGTYNVFFLFRWNGTTFTDSVTNYLLGNPQAGSTGVVWALLRFNAAGQIVIYDSNEFASTQPAQIGLATPSSGSWMDGKYHQCELSRTLTSSGTGSSYTLWIDGKVVFTDTFTSASGGTCSSEAFFHNGATGSTTIDIDDYLAWNSGYTAVNAQDFNMTPPVSSQTKRVYMVASRPNADVTDIGTSMTLNGGTTKHGILSTSFTSVSQSTSLSNSTETVNTYAGVSFPAATVGSSPTILFNGITQYWKGAVGANYAIDGYVNTSFRIGGSELITYPQGTSPVQLCITLVGMAKDQSGAIWTPASTGVTLQNYSPGSTASPATGSLFLNATEVLVQDYAPAGYVVTNISC